MKTLKKQIGLSLVLLAGLVILVHAVIPHHHFNDGCLLNSCSDLSHVHDHSQIDFKCLITNKLFVEKTQHFKLKKQNQVNHLLFSDETEKQIDFNFPIRKTIFNKIGYLKITVYILSENPHRAPPVTLA